MNESESKNEKPKEGRRLSQEQYDMLKRCSEKSDKKDMTIILAKHQALQEMSNHYNTINWTLHSIFIGLHGLFLVFLIKQLSGSEEINHFTIISCSVLGGGAAFVWWAIFRRHRSMIHEMYKQLHLTEQEIGSRLATDDQKFCVHLVLQKMDESLAHKRLFYFRTNAVIKYMQIVLWVFYILVALCFI